MSEDIQKLTAIVFLLNEIQLTSCMQSCRKLLSEMLIQHFMLTIPSNRARSFVAKMDRSFLTKYQVDLTKFQVDPMTFPSVPAAPPTGSVNRTLSDDFVPGDYDVICGRGKVCFNHIGNRRFRVTIAMNLKKYMESKSKLEKSLVVNSIVEQVRDASPNGGFVKRDPLTGNWFALGADASREKVGHAMRDAISSTQQVVKKKAAAAALKGNKLDMRRCSLDEAQKAIFASLSESNNSSSSSKPKRRRTMTARAC